MKDRNAWSLDLYLSKQIAEGTKKILLWNKGQVGSHPATLTEDEWNEILEKLNKAFWKYHTRQEKMSLDEELAFLESDQWAEAWDLFKKWFPHLWH